MPRSPQWSLVTNHALVLLVVWNDHNLTVREIAENVEITERAVHRILTDLEGAGYISRQRVGRRSRYTVTGDCPLRHPLVGEVEIQDLLKALQNHKR
jgi:DNA-binding MarR family transcriptional regulator